ncbi:hypothetical protein AGABI1DRAFT_76879 [Agaricus bisporus var. burnettii JB137-S8]|uniref:Heme haloperoxidase family profile domain-containing protein n=1 Tax=Agaricus bisporus var. burnettii (strain JB137-S8 / ATCC MYA-4627 / FGSC 10392) TaxID=597362 RepID=K5XSD1_AGABU|nr:uncharacterized protein AGABI1DRAFT_76879 [Agaricus bisporus var. burnettii JB137-S8]EKM77850.1 hypothetical protein AGABI1DRAFT_76879 [Agaricus bisporus var. burnettii JB137-S8]
MVCFTYFVTLALAYAGVVSAFPTHASLAGLSRDEVDRALASLEQATPTPPPGPLSDSGTKLVNDDLHPYIAPGENDIRGPCPALNALASHGYINRNGIANPAEIITAVMEGFNMDHGVAVYTTYAAFIVDGNLITNLLSIGEKTSLTGRSSSGTTAGGLNTHNTFEGDSSITRMDAYFGDNHNFNEKLFQEFIEYSNKYGGGKYNLSVACEFRRKRFQDSIATNPEFTIVAPRFYTAYADAVLPINLWVDGRQDDGQLDIEAARTFFEGGRFPPDFHRAARPMGANNEMVVFEAHPIEPGSNVKGVNTYTPDHSTPQKLDDLCVQYTFHVENTVRKMYPNPEGPLLESLKINLGYLFSAVKDKGCEELFPYGR